MQCSKINTHLSKCMILLECLTHHLVPESSPTPSHLPKPCMRIIILFVCGQSSDVYISIGPSPTIDIFSMDYPLIIIIIFRQPSETILSIITSCTHSYLSRVPSAYEMHRDAISITHITHAIISPCIYSHNLNHTIMLCNFTFHHIKN